MRKPLWAGLLSLIAGLILAANAAGLEANRDVGGSKLVQKPEQRVINDLVADMLKYYHYTRHELDDSLSARIYERYLEVLDPNRIYFLQQDIDSFEKFRDVLDDHIKAQNVEPAFVIYRVFQERIDARFEHAIKLLETEPRFNVDETYVFDRREHEWAKSRRELNEIWRMRVKNDAIGLILTDKTWDEARETLKNRYTNFRRRIGQVKSEDVFEIFINAYAYVMDPHTEYFSPRDSEEFQIRMSLSYEGIGAALQNQNEYVTVMRILPGGSADKTGLLKENDRITGVAQGDEEVMTDVIGWRLDDVVQLIRGPANSVVRLRILPAGEAPGAPEKAIRLVRSEIKLEEQAAQKKVVEVEREANNYRVGVIEVPAFYLDFKALQAGEANYRSTTRDVRRLLKELEKESVEGIIIDLRNNGGGSLWEATELVSLFIDKGPVVQVRNSDGKIQLFEDREAGIEYMGPLMVLVNRYSASASEIFAGAIQDYGRGLVVGSTTYGKGTVQTLVDLKRRNGWKIKNKEPGQLKLTTGKYYRVTGASTQHQGVIPDIILPSAIDPEIVGESAQE
ncbi:MAG: S41 family peptidase, partial [Gammaproteobacteria bacterium]